MVHTMKKRKTITPKEIALIGLLLAMNMVLSRVATFYITQSVRISFSFLPLALMAIMFGPWKSGIVNGIWDIVNVLMFAAYMPFPGYTLNAFLGPMFYGLFMHRKEIKWTHVLAPVMINTIFVNLFLGTLWLIILGGLPVFAWTSWAALLPGRLLSNAVMAPVRFGMILFCVKTPQIKKLLQKFSTAAK